MEFVEYEPEYIPEAIMNYYSCGLQVGRNKDIKDLILKAKKHLAAIGWSFFYIYKKPGRRELRYRSPAGKTYCSLRLACQDLIDHQHQHQDNHHDLESGSSKTEIFTEKKTKLENKNEFLSNSRPQKRIRIQDSEIEIFTQQKTSRRRPQKKIRIQDVEASYFHKKGEEYSCVNSNDDVGDAKDDKNKGFLSNDRPGKRIKRLMEYSGKKRNKKRIPKVVDSSTRRRCVLSLLIERKIVSQGSKVAYLSRKDGRVLAEGRVYEEGIQCDCCGEFFLLSKFEAHAGSTYRRPAANIFLEDGRSLLDCQTQLTHENERTGQDDFCSFCNDGGDLVLCDSCTSSFHASCIGLNGVPESDYWFCPSCCCQICLQDHSLLTNEDSHDHSLFTNEDSHDHGKIKCKQCEHYFHTDCLRKKGVLISSETVNWFCSEKCERIFSGLMGIAGKSIPSNVDNLSWSLLKLDHNDENDVNSRTETNGKLNVALDVMHECFKPLKHPRSDGDVVEDVIFSRCSKKTNFNGFFTAVLERDEEMITVVTVRVHGCKAAEIPLVATRFRYRRMGMCRILMDEIERMMQELGVERLVLPAVPEMVRTWTESFGFKVMDEMERFKLVGCKFLDFPGTIKCQKILKEM